MSEQTARVVRGLIRDCRPRRTGSAPRGQESAHDWRGSVICSEMELTRIVRRGASRLRLASVG